MATVHLTRNGWAGSAHQPNGEPSFGEWLRRAREARGLTLDGVTQQTRIPRRHLEALEGGDLTLLPEFYQRSEVRAIARVVGLDEHAVLARLDAAVAPPVPEVDVAPAQPARRGTPSAALVIGAVVLGAYALGVISGRWLAAEAVADARGTRSSLASQAPLPLDAPTDARFSPPISSLAPADAQAHVIAASAVSSDIALNETLAAAPVSSAAAPAITELLVTTEPSGARVTVNGIGWGTTPVAIRHLTPGAKRIRVSKDGYQAAERVLPLEQGSKQSVAIELPALR